jgi:NADH-quinone oxidoreductase subunit L
MPHTYRTFIIGSLALAGIFPLAGFFSKDEIIGSALRAASEEQQVVSWFVLIAAAVTAFLTALYMTRACVKTFFGEYRGHGQPHESPGSMVTPLWILAGGSLTVGFLGFPVIGPFQDWVTVPGHEPHGFSTLYNLLLPVGSVAIAVFAIWIGYTIFYRNKWRVDILSGPFAWTYRLAENGYYIDDFYLKYIVRPVQYAWARATYWIDQKVIDGVVNGTAKETIGGSRFVYDTVDQQIVDFAVNGAAGLSGGILRYVQTGNVQRYAALLFASIAVFVALLAIS